MAGHDPPSRYLPAVGHARGMLDCSATVVYPCYQLHTPP